MGRFSLRRVALAFAVVAVVWALQAALLSPDLRHDRYANSPDDPVVPPRENVTVVTTSPFAGSASGSIVAFDPNGSVLYYNETNSRYYDVDPVPGTLTTVEYVTEVREDCPPTTDLCRSIRYERVNLTTGDVGLVHEFILVNPKGWHDIDRVGEDRLLVADFHSEIFVVNTTTDVRTWGYHFRSRFERENGGNFPNDWTHLNDVEELPDGRIMASPRNMDQVTFFTRDRGLQRSWTLGEDGDYETLNEPHNPDYIPESRGGPAVVIGDSGNNRVAEYQRRDGEWVRTWEWRDRRMAWPRDADRLPNGHTLVADSNGNRVLELDRNGSVVWSVPIDTPYEAERLGTGDESAGGWSAASLGLENGTIGAGTQSGDLGRERSSGLLTTAATTVVAVSLGVVDLLPDVLVNGLVFVLPPAVSRLDVAMFLTTVLTALACAVIWFSLDLLGVPDTVREWLATLISRYR